MNPILLGALASRHVGKDDHGDDGQGDQAPKRNRARVPSGRVGVEEIPEGPREEGAQEINA